MLRIGALLLALFFTTLLIAQDTPTVPNSFIVSLNTTEHCANILRAHNISFKSCEKIGDLMHMWRIESTPEMSDVLFLQKLNTLSEVRLAQQNHYIEHRSKEIRNSFTSNIPTQSKIQTLPDDPNFNKQYYLHNTGQNYGTPSADLDMLKAWSYTTGGTSSIGDEIVVCVIDHGFDYTHNDLGPNLWNNTEEIPFNGIDDDENGYIDDFMGWNVFGHNDDILGLGLSHGTQVAGVIGAKGNNALDITGINWDIKIQCLVAGQTEDKLLAAYAYAYKCRKTYNESHGQSGAYVVATNASMGIPYGQANDAPLWCGVFEELGAVGILNCAPAPNEAIDVDMVGDLPTTCGSGFLITSTALTNNDELHSSSAWGAQSIDIGAYGTDIHTLSPNQTCSAVSGTSFSAPQVAAAVALLYASNCSDLPALSKDTPASAALFVRNTLLNNTTQLPDLQQVTSNEGKLNIGESLVNYVTNCSVCTPPFDAYASQKTYKRLVIEWSETTLSHRADVRWRLSGASSWNHAADQASPFTISNLDTCQQIELQLRSWCDGEMGQWSPLKFYSTKGCCLVPTAMKAINRDTESISLEWEAENSSAGFLLRWKKPQEQIWNETFTANASFTAQGLLPCTDYDFQVKALCGPMDWSNTLQSKTKGCGACTDHDYCSIYSGSALSEYIELIEIGTWSHSVGAGAGYQSFAGDAVGQQIPLELGVPIPVKLTPGFGTSGSFKEYFRIFIDLNHDGLFDDSTECVFDPGYACFCPVEGFMNLSPSLQEGVTRMRIVMQFHDNQSGIPAPCTSIDYGQIADYCVSLGQPSTNTSLTENAQTGIRIYPNPTSDFLFIEKSNQSSSEFQVVDMQGKQVLQFQLEAGIRSKKIGLSHLENGIYFVHQIGKDASFRTKFVLLK